FAFACARLGRAKSGLYKRRVRDPAFDAMCKAALRRFNSSPSLSGGGGPSKTVEGQHATILCRYRNRPQLRRARPGTLTRAGRRAFLDHVALTGTIRF